MELCEDCGTLLESGTERDLCVDCRPEEEQNEYEILLPDGGSDGVDPDVRTELAGLPTTDSGAVKKRDAVRWLESLNEPSSKELRAAITPKPDGFEGSTFPTDISNVRVTGDAEFVETIAGLFQPFLEMEDHRYRLQINLQETKNKDTGEKTGNYALYLSVAERSG